MAVDRKLLDECVHCGFCLPACPTYVSWGEEMDSPRGRIYLIKGLAEGQPLEPMVALHFDRCLGCMGCMTACPSGVKYDALIEETRAEVEAQHRRPLGERLFRALLFALFPHPRRLRFLLFWQWLYVALGVRWLTRRTRILRLFGARVVQLDALMPEVRWRHVRARLPVTSPPRGPRRARVALLGGCVQRVYFPEVNAATLRVLNAEGCEVVVPRGLGCCGALSLHAGRQGEARRFARRVIERFERCGAELLVTNAAGCGSCLKEYGRLFRDDARLSERARAVAARVRDVNELLCELGPVAPRHPLAVRAAYHDACHLAHAQGIRAQPRVLLQGIPGLTLLEVPEGEQCCGSAGIYNLIQPESAREIGERKLANVLSVRPELLVSANPGCTLQLQMLLRERGEELQMAHPIEVLDASLRGE